MQAMIWRIQKISKKIIWTWHGGYNWHIFMYTNFLASNLLDITTSLIKGFIEFSLAPIISFMLWLEKYLCLTSPHLPLSPFSGVWVKRLFVLLDTLSLEPMTKIPLINTIISKFTIILIMFDSSTLITKIWEFFVFKFNPKS